MFYPRGQESLLILLHKPSFRLLPPPKQPRDSSSHAALETLWLFISLMCNLCISVTLLICLECYMNRCLRNGQCTLYLSLNLSRFSTNNHRTSEFVFSVNVHPFVCFRWWIVCMSNRFLIFGLRNGSLHVNHSSRKRLAIFETNPTNTTRCKRLIQNWKYLLPPVGSLLANNANHFIRFAVSF